MREASAKTREFASVLKLLEAGSENADLKSQFAQLRTVLARLHDMPGEEAQRQNEFLKSEFGVDDDWLREFERAAIPTVGKEYWTSEIQQVPTTCKLEDVAAYGYDRLMIEHLRGLGQLPGDDFRFFAVPVKVKNMGTFPVRAVGLVEEPA